jgi:transposase
MNTCGSCTPMFRQSVTKMENDNLEQRYTIKFCVKLGKGATDTHEKIHKAFGNDSSCVQVFRWHKDFENGRETVKDEPRSGRPASVRSTNVDCVRAFICQDRRITIRMTAELLHKI